MGLRPLLGQLVRTVQEGDAGDSTPGRGPGGDTPLGVVVVNTAETEDEVFSFLGQVAPDLTPLMDSSGVTTERWGPHGLPATFLVDPEGVIRYRALGGRPWDQAPYLGFLRSLAGR